MRKVSDNQRLIEKYRKKYWSCKNRREKGMILSELEELTGYDRKHIIRELLNSRNLEERERQYTFKHKLKRKGKYDCIQLKLKQLWQMSNYATGKRLVGSLPSLIDSLLRFKEISLTLKEKQLLLEISPATIDRRLKQDKIKSKQLIRNPPGTTRGDLLKSQIPIRTHRDWVEKTPGYLEIDTVHHCSGDLSGIYALTLDTVDVYSGWNECQAMLGKSGKLVMGALSVIKQRFALPLKGIDFDDGSEFVNFDLVTYCNARGITCTRSRSDRKNDQCFIEQNNDSVVRRYVGYARYQTKQELLVLNRLYATLSDYYNYFQAVMRLKTKVYHQQHRTPSRKYDQAQTPYQRLMTCPDVKARFKDKLTSHYLTLNPKQLRSDILKLQHLLVDLNRQNRPQDYMNTKIHLTPEK